MLKIPPSGGEGGGHAFTFKSRFPSSVLHTFFFLQPVSPKVTEISMGEFLTHSTAVWLNPHPSLGRIRKDPEMTVFGERAC